MYSSVEDIREKIVNACGICGHKGYLIVPTDTGARFDNCACVEKAKTFVRYLNAGVPERFWDFDIDNDLTPEFHKKNKLGVRNIILWINHIEELIDMGAGLLLWSTENGTAKSAMAAYIARVAISCGISVKWLNGGDIHSGLTSFAEVKVVDDIDNVRLVVIDEIDKIYLPNESNGPRQSRSSFTELFDRLYRRKVAIVATGNLNVDTSSNKTLDLKQLTYPSSVLDRMAEWDAFQFHGVGFREGRSKPLAMMAMKDRAK